MSEEQTLQFLNQQQAEQRFNWIKQGTIHYKLHLRYNKGELFQGQVEATFDLLENFKQEDQLFFDFQGKTIHCIYVNGTKLSEINYDGLFIKIKGEHLKLSSTNSVFISYENQYANDGNGLHSFTDQDGKQYLYSQCEAFFCNKIFPVFDQPDLKGTLSMEVDAPNDWVVLFNTDEDQKALQDNQFQEIYQEEFKKFQSQNQEGYVHHSFPPTLTLPSYLWGFIAGPFCKISHSKPYNNIPMNIYVRESLFKYAEKQSDFIFEITDKCLAEYEKYFGYKFAFPKYDQIFCPEFNCGAMENAGLVTFNDLYIFKEEVEATKLTSFTNTIAHEIAHHWFGNLVTMKWWDGLWLNESFADFISHFILSKINITTRKTSNIWVLFNQRKGWGYRDDQLQTTHPIAGEVANTEEAESIFDGITYAKGAASLRQVLSLMGEENFSKALQSYFHTFAFKNATLNDFIGKLNEQFSNPNFTLLEWQNLWLTKAGLNECTPSFNPSDNSTSAQLKITQTVALPQHPTLRMHQMQIAFFQEDGSIISQSILVKPQSETVIEYDGSKNYKACLLNYCDEAFVKVVLDEHSINFFKQNLHKVQDLLTRTLIWRTFYDMARDGVISSEEYIDIFLNSIGKETSNEIISNQYNFIASALLVLTPNKYQEPLADRLFNFTLQLLQNTDKSENNKIVILRNKIFSFAKSSKSVEQLLKWYNNEEESLKDIDMGLANQWTVVTKVNKSEHFSLEQKKEIFERQAKIDSSDTQKNMKAKCDALQVKSEDRQKLFDVYLDKNQKLFSLRQLQYSMGGFNNSEKIDELQTFYEQWYDNLENYTNVFSKDQLLAFYSNLFPETDDISYLIQKLEAKIQKISGKEEFIYLKKLLAESVDDLKRKEKCFKCFYERAALAQSKL